MTTTIPPDLHPQLVAAHQFYTQGNLPEARRLADALIRLDPHYADAFHLIGLIRWRQSDRAGAIDSMRRASSLQPLVGRYHYNLGTMLQETGKEPEAVAELREALKVEPENLSAMNNLAALLIHAGELTEGESLCRKIIGARSDFPEAYTNLCNALREQGKIDEAIGVYRELISRNPRYYDALSNYCLTLNYSPKLDREEIFEEHCRCAGRFPLDKTAHDSGTTVTAVRERALRVGYVSGDFRNHSVARFFEPVLANHDPARVETVCFYNGHRTDQVTERLMRIAGKWRTIRGISDDQVRSIIREDGIDILVDLSGHTADNRLTLFSRRVAPVQACYLGYPNTTGLKNMDFRITDRWADPPGQERFFTETLIRLQGGFLCYGPPVDCPSVNESPALANGFITFGSFNNLAKVNASVIALWASILCKVPGSRLVLKNRQLADKEVQARYRSLFESLGISPRRILLLPPLPEQHEHLSTYHTIDIALDTFPYNGTTTTCEALWMGVPVVSLCGDSHASRVGVSILSRLGLGSLAAGAPESYRRICAHLSADPGYLAGLRRGLRTAVLGSPLCDAKALSRELENAFDAMIRTGLRD